MDRVWDNICSISDNQDILSIEELFPKWHNDTCLTICFYNLFEKWACGTEISDKKNGSDCKTMFIQY